MAPVPRHRRLCPEASWRRRRRRETAPSHVTRPQSGHCERKGTPTLFPVWNGSPCLTSGNRQSGRACVRSGVVGGPEALFRAVVGCLRCFPLQLPAMAYRGQGQKVQKVMVQPIVSFPQTEDRLGLGNGGRRGTNEERRRFVFHFSQNLIFRYLQNRSRIQVWLYEQVNMRIEGCIIVELC
ncbi:hypothetical protein JD844_018365 [Phrynosoma platyrhinos]|uniref:Uncharacterized protein n=1 Tax=Phrynosoma platyrhinos TaxID=52577 RepID=A0ABQ7SND0_PHRPL|nr:hypothetical protein JD844_018365 [Phrynosoma platyrhinos]